LETKRSLRGSIAWLQEISRSGGIFFEELGGFDEALQMTEDTDLGYRATIKRIPLVTVQMQSGITTTLRPSRAVYCSTGSAFWTAKLIRKHPEVHDLLPIYLDTLPIDWKKIGLLW